MKRNSIFHKIAFSCIILLLCFAMRAQAQDSGRTWALKTGLGGIFTDHISGEVEVFLKGRVSIALRGALIKPNLDALRGPAEGFFVKAGPKFYFSKEKATRLEGFAVQPQAVFSYWKNWQQRPYTLKRWEYAVGALCSVSYGWRPFEHVMIEPHIGLGIVPTFEDNILYNDQPPFENWKQSWWRLDKAEISGGLHSHLPLSNFIAISGGINIGIQF